MRVMADEVLDHNLLLFGQETPLDSISISEFYNQLAVSIAIDCSPVIYSRGYQFRGRSRNYYMANDCMGEIVFDALLEKRLVQNGPIEPRLPALAHLTVVHDMKYLRELLVQPSTYKQFMGIGETKMKSFRHDFQAWMDTQLLQVSGSILAVHVALEVRKSKFYSFYTNLASEGLVHQSWWRKTSLFVQYSRMVLLLF